MVTIHYFCLARREWGWGLGTARSDVVCAGALPGSSARWDRTKDQAEDQAKDQAKDQTKDQAQPGAPP